MHKQYDFTDQEISYNRSSVTPNRKLTVPVKEPPQSLLPQKEVSQPNPSRPSLHKPQSGQ